MKMQSVRHLSVFVTAVAVLSSVLSCKSYDEQDVTIIAYLKVNDLIEQKLSQTCEAEISQFEDDYSKHINLTSLGLLGVTDVFYQTFGYNANADDPILKYDVNAINTFFANFYDEETESFKSDQIEAQISSDLWDYMSALYSDALPAKAQNVEEGRYYTITELKQKYPEYDEFNLEGFRPMELINTVINEDFFGASLYADGEFNLYTLYVYYVEYKPKVYISPGRTPYKDPEYVQMNIDHVGNPTDVEVDSVLSVFYDMCTRENPWYTNDTEGFKNFIIAYYETDLFSGADLEYVEE